MRLTGLQSESDTPEYNRGDLVSGTLELKSASSVVSVDVKVRVWTSFSEFVLLTCLLTRWRDV